MILDARGSAVSDTGNVGGGSGVPDQTVDFRVGEFIPTYYPDDVRDTKERSIDSEESLCEGEYKKDTGGKNRTFHIIGIALLKNKYMLENISEAGEPMMLQSLKWSGEVLVEKVQRSKIIGWDGSEESYWFDYTIDAVSTGRDERGETNYGIIR